MFYFRLGVMRYTFSTKKEIFFKLFFFFFYSSDIKTSFQGYPHDCPSSKEDELSEGDEEEPPQYNGHEFPSSATLKEDH